MSKTLLNQQSKLKGSVITSDNLESKFQQELKQAELPVQTKSIPSFIASKVTSAFQATGEKIS